MDLIIIALLVVAILAGHYMVRRQLYGPSVGRAFAKHSVTSIGDITLPGRYRLAGKAIAIGDAPVSEASGRPWLARDMRIDESSSGDSGTIRPARQAVDFLLDDGTGTVLVRGDGATVAIDRNFEMPQTTLDQVPWVDELLRAGGYFNESPKYCKIKLREGVLQEGTLTGVVGHLEIADAEARRLGAKWVVQAEGGTPVAIRPEVAIELTAT